MKICPQCGKAHDDAIQVCPSDHSQLILINPSDDPMIGKLIDDRYRLIRKIGEGGMGAIYRAVHVENLRVCAIKLMTGLSKEDAIARFKREARNSVRIDSAHAVTVYDSGQTDEGLLFLAMEFIDGKPLSRVIAEERVLPIERVIHITNQIAEALAAAHSLPMIHRDLKPDNIMITRKGSNTDFVKVLDFGIAKALADPGGDNLTKTGFVLGTPVYMSPEQLLGEELDPRSDIYSLAIIVYEMLSGRLPFEGDNPQAVMMKRVMSEPIRLRAVAPTVSESVEVAVMAGLTRNRDTRPQTVEAFASALSRVTYGGTRIMGGAVTEQISTPGDGRTTAQFGGHQTRVDSSPAFTSQSPSSSTSGTRANPPATSGTRGNPTPFAPTDITQAATKPQHPDTAPETRVESTPVYAAPVTVRDLPPTALADPIIAKPESSRGKGFVIVASLVLAVVAIAAIVYILLRPAADTKNGFALLIKGAPAGSQVFINDVRRDAVSADGGLRISGIDPGSINIRVSREGFTDYAATLTGNKGETQTCEAQLLPATIDYSGPMVAVAAGEFVMGDDNHEADERPAHKVSVASFYLDKYEVSNAQYKKFCDATGHNSPLNPGFDPDYFAGKPDYPVLGVTFEDALAYASWAGKRLPTEQEWEKAASWDSVAHRKRQYTWGDQFTSDRANIATGHPVPTTEATGDLSPYGALNMAGNALEWVDAPYGPYEGNRTSDPDFQKGDRVIRGGTFVQASKTEEARGSYRNHAPRVFPAGKSLPVGIRCVISANDSRIQALLQANSR